MAARFRTSASKPQPSPDINITPLVDVCLVLLIIFMVVAPALNDGAHIELPKVMAPDPKTKDVDAIELTMTSDGTLILEGQVVSANELVPKVTALHQKQLERAIILKVDEGLKYKKVRETFKTMQDIGFKGVLLKVAEKKKPGAAS